MFMISLVHGAVQWQEDFETITGDNCCGFTGDVDERMAIMNASCFDGSCYKRIGAGTSINMPTLSSLNLTEPYFWDSYFKYDCDATQTFYWNVDGTNEYIISPQATGIWDVLSDDGGTANPVIACSTWIRFGLNMTGTNNATCNGIGYLYINESIIVHTCHGGDQVAATKGFNLWTSTGTIWFDNIAVCDNSDADCYDSVYGSPPAPGPTDFNITLDSPGNDTYNISYNNSYCYTPQFNTTAYGCHFYTNVTGNWERNLSNTSAITNTSSNCFNWNNTKDETLIWNVMCNDTSENSVFAAYNYTFSFDTVNPVLTVTSPDNNSYYSSSDTLIINTSCTDNTVYILNVTFYNSSNATSYQNTTTSGTELTIYEELSLGGYADGDYLLNVSCSDGHTESIWEPTAPPSSIKDGIRLDGIDITLGNIDGGALSTFKAIKEPDRYTFELDFDNIINSFEYVITADKIVRYGSQYKGHLILNDKYWFDTEPYTPEYIHIDGNTVRIKISGVKGSKVITESIGGLNIITDQYNITIDNAVPYFSTPTINQSYIFLYDYIDFHVLITENSSGNYTVATNNTGSWVNSSVGAYTPGENVSTITQMNNGGETCYHFWANDSAGNVNVTSDICFNVSHNRAPVYINPEQQSLRSNISIIFGNITNTTINITLFYNDTLYYPTSQMHMWDNEYQFNYTIVSPNVTAISENISFYFEFNYTYLNGTLKILRNTSTYNQEISQSQILYCGGISNSTTLNFTFRHENNDERINVDVEMVFDIWVNDPTLFNTYSFNFTDTNNATICIYPYDMSFYTNTYIKYTHDTGFTHRYYLVSANLTNETSGLSLYNFNGTSGISDLKGTIRRSTSYAYFPNVYASLLRYYPSTHTWKIVQMDKSDDFGQIFFNVIEESQDYKVLFNYDLYQIEATESMKFICTSGLCELTFLMEPHEAGTAATNLTYTYSYDNDTGIITMTWNDPTGLTDEVRLYVAKQTASTSIGICNNSLASAAGSLTCNISSYDGTFIVKGFSSASPETPFFMRWIEKLTTALHRLPTFPTMDGAIWAFGISLTIVAFGLFSPFGAILAYLFSLVILIFLKIHPLVTIPFITIAAVLGLIIGSKVKR